VPLLGQACQQTPIGGDRVAAGAEHRVAHEPQQPTAAPQEGGEDGAGRQPGGGQVVPAVDGGVRELKGRADVVAGGLLLAVVESFQQPVGKQRGDGLGEPLAQA
jgi:hypothetical protein